ncbi:MAG TPA: sulfur carrier protein ThiS [Phycisphaerales bacterium]|nr:sulfur carrier protein ThiS [Phycisphaerales bacterium]
MANFTEKPASTISITLNGDHAALPANCTVQQLLAVRGLSNQPCAVEVNKFVVPKARHASHRLASGDIIEIVTLVGGG